MSSAKRGYGTLVKIGNAGSPEVFTSISEVLELDFTSDEGEEIDVTNTDSPSRRQETIPGIIKNGTLAVKCNFIPSDSAQTGIKTKFEAGTTHNWQVVLSNSQGTLSFAGWIKNHVFKPPLRAQQTMEFTVNITGAVVYAA